MNSNRLCPLRQTLKITYGETNLRVAICFSRPRAPIGWRDDLFHRVLAPLAGRRIVSDTPRSHWPRVQLASHWPRPRWRHRCLVRQVNKNSAFWARTVKKTALFHGQKSKKKHTNYSFFFIFFLCL